MSVARLKHLHLMHRIHLCKKQVYFNLCSIFKMGKHFGELAKIRGLITYKLSPHEQRAYAGAISNGIPNIFRRFRENVFRVAPPFIIGYLVYEGVEREHHRLGRKNPADFENDQ